MLSRPIRKYFWAISRELRASLSHVIRRAATSGKSSSIFDRDYSAQCSASERRGFRRFAASSVVRHVSRCGSPRRSSSDGTSPYFDAASSHSRIPLDVIFSRNNSVHTCTRIRYHDATRESVYFAARRHSPFVRDRVIRLSLTVCVLREPSFRLSRSPFSERKPTTISFHKSSPPRQESIA